MLYLEIELSRWSKWDTLTGMGAGKDVGLGAGQVWHRSSDTEKTMCRPEQQSKNTEALQPLPEAIERQGKQVLSVFWDGCFQSESEKGNFYHQGRKSCWYFFFVISFEMYLFCFPQFHQCSSSSCVLLNWWAMLGEMWSFPLCCRTDVS